MLRISRLADYALVVLTELCVADEARSATALARATGVSKPTVAKLLKRFAAAGWVGAQRGSRGGYRCQRAPAEISVAQVLALTDGPLALNACVTPDDSLEPGCALQSQCGLAETWQQINGVVFAALDALSMADLVARRQPAMVQLRLRAGAPPASEEARRQAV